jgi:hypothetical protein
VAGSWVGGRANHLISVGDADSQGIRGLFRQRNGEPSITALPRVKSGHAPDQVRFP